MIAWTFHAAQFRVWYIVQLAVGAARACSHRKCLGSMNGPASSRETLVATSPDGRFKTVRRSRAAFLDHCWGFALLLHLTPELQRRTNVFERFGGSARTPHNYAAVAKHPPK